MTDEVFTIKEDNEDIVILEITDKRKDPLFIAEHPYIHPDWLYISVTGCCPTNRSYTHVLSAIKEDGSVATSLSWGSTTTLISGNTEILRNKVKQFLSDNGFYVK